MSTYAIDSNRQEMVATGIVEPVFEWTETPEGRRRPSDVQARDENTGMPLWSVEVSYRSESFGRAYTVNAMVSVGSPEPPNPATFTHITFENLRVDVRLNKAGGFVERWAAESVKDLIPDESRPNAAGAKGPEGKTDRKAVA